MHSPRPTTLPILLALAAGILAAAPRAQTPAETPRLLEARPVETPESGSSPLPQPERADYRIGEQDLLEIRVFGLEELNQTVRVANDGTISLPLLGRLPVVGLSKSELETTLARLLEEDFVRDPQVTVFVKEYESKKVAVTGAVRNPGNYEMLGRKTLLEMISLAGGLDGEVGREIIIFRNSDGSVTRRIPIDLDRLVYDADPALNVPIDAGDIVYVPAIEKMRIFVSGAVKNPNLYEVPRAEPVTVLRAITLAGGTTDRAAEKRVQILRTGPDGSRITLTFNLKKIKRGKAEDPVLQKDDLVLVPEAFF